MKSTISITLDTEVAIEAKQIPNISATVNNFLREHLQFKRQNPGDSEEDLKNNIIHLKATLAASEQEMKALEKKTDKKKKVIIHG